VHRAQEALEAAHANLLGVVLNRSRRRVNGYYDTRTYGVHSAEPAKPEEESAGS